ncbi:GreA/GreB family elongation factor [Ruminococcaceae bacterium OttesenSCG-928-O06]|nr:GreA/GreB family elongation factor [Ruminococcaceae bacterium OttesenSCG-928-O06]
MPQIMLTSYDKEKLLKTIQVAVLNGDIQDAAVRELRNEIGQAAEMEPQEMPADVVTMNTKAILHIDKEDLEIVLVYPDEADWSKGKLSVLSPIGTAILGYRQGDIVEWSVPSGTAKIEIKKVVYQPEASGDE